MKRVFYDQKTNKLKENLKIIEECWRTEGIQVTETLFELSIKPLDFFLSMVSIFEFTSPLLALPTT